MSDERDSLRAKLDAKRREIAERKAAEQKPPPKPAPKRTPLPKPKPDDVSPPAAPEIEHALLGVILRNPAECFNKFEQLGDARFFTDPINRELYALAKRFYEENGRFDLIGFSAELRDSGYIDKRLDGTSFRIVDAYTQTTPLEIFDYYTDALRDKYLARKIQAASFAWAGKAKNESASALLSEIAQRLNDWQRTANKSELSDAATFLNGEMPPIPGVVIHHLLHRGSKMIVGGTSKSNKTWALMDLALSVATGNDWWGFHTNRSRVCYINLEIQEGFFAARLKAICERRNILPEHGWFKLMNLRGRADGIENLHRYFTTLLGAGSFGLVVIDPVYKVLGRRDENRAGDIATMLNEIESIAVETEAAIVFAAHYSKGNQAQKESIDRIGGSGVFARDPDTVVTMTQHEDEDCFTVDTTLRNMSPIFQFVLHWKYPLFTRDDEKNPQNLKGKLGAPATWSGKDILDQMSVVNGLKVSHLQEQCYDRLGMAKTTFYRHWNPMRKERTKIRCDTDGLWYRKSPNDNSDTSDTSDTTSVSE